MIANTASIASTDSTSPLSSTATVSVTSPVLTLTSSASQSYAAPGDTITYTLTYTDKLANAANVVLTDALPANLTYVPGSATGGASYNAGTLTWTPGNLSTGNSGTVTFQAIINAGLAAGTTITNNASITGTQMQAALTSTCAISVTLPMLTLTTTANPTAAAPGDTITCTLSYGVAVSGAGNVTLTDVLPANLTYVPGSASGGAVYSAGTLTWNLGHLNAPSSASVTFQATVNAGVAAGTLISDSASIACSEAPVPVSSTAGITVAATVLTLSNSAAQSNYAPGAVITYTLSYGDALGNAANTVLTDSLPASLSYVPGSASGGASYNAGTLTWNLGHLTAPSTASVTFQAVVNAGLANGTLITNSAGISCAETAAPVTAGSTVTVAPNGAGAEKYYPANQLRPRRRHHLYAVI